MFYSAVMVTARPDALDKAIDAVRGESVEIHQIDRGKNRFIGVIEGDTVDSESDIFVRLQDLPDVADVSLIVHREDTGQ